MKSTGFFDRSAIELMKISGLLFIVTSIIFAALEISIIFVDIGYLGLIASLVLSAAIVLLGISIRKIGDTSPHLDADAKTAGFWLIAFVIIDIITSILGMYEDDSITIINGILALFMLIIGVYAWTKVNTVFKKIRQSQPQLEPLDSVMFQIYGWYGVIILVAILVTAFTLLIPLIFGVAILAVVGQFILLLAIGIKLRSNAVKIESISTIPISTPTPVPAYAPIQSTTVDQATLQPVSRFCDTCGSKIDQTAKFCSNCGANV